MDFTDGIVFLNGISAPEITVPELVSGVDINEFVKTALLNNIEQEFNNPIHLESCIIESTYKRNIITSIYIIH